MDEYAAAAVEAALDAGARYADARVMISKTESMSAQNGVVERLQQDETAGVGVRALVGVVVGVLRHPDPHHGVGARRPAAGPPRPRGPAAWSPDRR